MITSELGVLIMGTLWGILILIPMISLLNIMDASFFLYNKKIYRNIGPSYIKEEEDR